MKQISRHHLHNMKEASKEKVRKVQTLFRLWTDHRLKFFKRLLADDLSSQILLEAFVMAYLERDERIMGFVRDLKKQYKGDKRPRRDYFGLDDDETAQILKAIQGESPLKE